MNIELRPLIEQAIRQEELAHEFYTRLAKLVTHEDTRETLEWLAKDELEHKAFLESCLTPSGCTLVGEAHDTHLAEVMKAPAITAEMTPKEALMVAMKREEGSYHFYQRLASLQPPGEAREFLEKMAKIELAHKEKVEYLFANVAFPEVW
ncbi:MAG: ferritin family protein [Desulfobaccales bacterium]